MPRIVEYPHASFKSAFEIATAVDYLGGSCTLQSCAERLKKKIGGGFKSTVAAAMKHGLITNKKDILSITELFKVYKLAYNEQEKMETMRKSFLFPALYRKVYDRFKGKELPVSMLDKLLVREFGVEESYASRVSGYFIDGAKSLNMLENGRLTDAININSEDDKEDYKNEAEIKEEEGKNDMQVIASHLPMISTGNVFTVMIAGPGMNSKIEINEEDDLVILDAMITKIKKKLKEGSE